MTYNRILLDRRLTSDAKVYFQLLHQHADSPLKLEHYSKQLGWGRTKQAKVMNMLKQAGYVSQEQRGLGKTKGCEYTYRFSPDGDLLEAHPPLERKERLTKCKKREIIRRAIENHSDNNETSNKRDGSTESPVAPTGEDILVFEAVLEAFNIHGLDSTKRKIREAGRKRFIKNFRPGVSDEEIGSIAKEIYNNIAEGIIESEKYQFKSVGRSDWF